MTSNTTPQMLHDGQADIAAAIWNRGLNYGDGLFETIAFIDGGTAFWPWHMRRLQQGCERLRLGFPGEAVLAAECARLVTGFERCVIRLTVYRGAGGRGYYPHHVTHSHRLLSRHSWPEPSDQTLAVGVSSIRLAPQPLLAGMKHLNRLEQVLAASECERNGWDEAIMMSASGQVTCAMMGNLLVHDEQGWVTPALDECGIAGVTRQWLLDQQPLPLRVGTIALEQLQAADQVAVINSVRGARIVGQIAGRSLRPGKQSRRLVEVIRGFAAW